MAAPPPSSTAPLKDPALRRGAFSVSFWLILGYIGIYLVRKNLGVANPMLQEHFGVNKEAVGVIATYGTIGYMAGKFINGPVVDRLGGRTGFLLAMLGAGVFGALGGFMPSLVLVAVIYALNRYAAAGGWAAMMKLSSSWFPPGLQATAIAALSISYVVGGILAGLLAGYVAKVTNDWRMVMSLPAIVLGAIAFGCFLFVRPGPLRELPADEAPAAAPAADPVAERGWQVQRNRLLRLLSRREYVVLCVLSFTLTLLREALSTWSVDFLVSVSPERTELYKKAFETTTFDAAGLVSILLTGVLWDRIDARFRRWVIAGILLLLAVSLWAVVPMTRGSALGGMWMLAAIGFLLYAPYSVLAGAGALEAGGTDLAGTASGFIDGIGYLAAILAGQTLGMVLDRGGYDLAFSLLAGLTFLSAFAALGLGTRRAVAVVAQEAASEVAPA